MADANDMFSFYHRMPIISKLYLTAACGISGACFLEILSPLTLYYNYELIMMRGQYWRLITSFLFFGAFGLDFLFHMYFVVNYCRMLEEGAFRGRTADFVFLLLFGAVSMVLFTMICPAFSSIRFLGHPLSFMLVYLWSRQPENVGVVMGFFGILVFEAPYLPWVLLLFSLVFGNPIEMDLLGMIVGHIYYFLNDVYPKVAAIRQWRIRKILITPFFLHSLFGTQPDGGIHIQPQERMPVEVVNMVAGDGGGDAGVPPPAGAAIAREGVEMAPNGDQEDGHQHLD